MKAKRKIKEPVTGTPYFTYHEQPRAKGYVHIGNTSTATIKAHAPRYTTLKTLYYGRQAFDLNGVKLPRGRYKPMFLHVSELKAYDRIMRDV